MDNQALTLSLQYDDWTVTETQFDPVRLQARETVFTLGNGYLGTRGSFEEGYPSASPSTLIYGVYDDVPVFYTELANCPDWLPLTIAIDGDRFRLDQGEVLSYRRKLDLRYAILTREVRWRSPNGKTIDLYFERFTSFSDAHVLAMRVQVTPVDCDGIIEVQNSLNGYPENQGFNHWERVDQGKLDPGIWLHLRTRGSRIDLGMATRMRVVGVESSLQISNPPGYPTLTTAVLMTAGQTLTIEKQVTVYTSRDIEKPVSAAQTKLAALPEYAALLKAHQQAWDQAWEKSDIVIEGDRTAQLAVRYNIFQLLISAPYHVDRVSVAAKTLSGFGYRGHVFWDTEIFILPFFIFTQPTLARSLLSYRYSTLGGARRKAKHYGYKGAMFAWESAETGDEVTPRWLPPRDDLYGEDVRIWCRDREIHISADIAYAIWSYWQATGDDEWMRDYGAEIVLDTAVFWASRVEWNAGEERYEIREVIGADEYHEYVSNNAFTNRIVQWHLQKALVVYDWLCQKHPDHAVALEHKLQLTSERRVCWQNIVAHIWIPIDAATDLVEQFEGFFKLKDVDLKDYEPRQKSMQVILGISEINKWQILKQPDVLMLFYLMRFFQEAPYSPEALQKNWDYYAPKTDITYGSSLGPAIHAILASDVGEDAYEQFMPAALVDLEDTRGNAYEGIHGASAGGTWQAVVFGFGGVQCIDNQLVAHAHLPSHWTRLQFQLHWQGHWYSFDLKSTDLKSTDLKSTDLKSMDNSASHPAIQGVIFDLDGVLTDTAEYHYRSWQRLADEVGLPFSREENEALRGVPRRESLLHIVGDRHFSEDQIQEMMARKNRFYEEFIQTITPDDLLPGALDLLKELRQNQIKIAIGSASKNARAVVERLGIADCVDAIADGYSVERSKPAPDLFLYAAQQIGLPPEHCVVVEDAASGIEAALAAGMLTVGLGPEERVGKAAIVLPDLEGVHVGNLIPEGLAIK
jgi:kojibiose phosphorylase